MCGNFSAVGLAVADIQHDYVRTIAKSQQDINLEELSYAFKALEREGVQQLKEENVKDENIFIEWTADLRYEGQSWELNTPIERSPVFGPTELKNILSSFHSLHQKVYSYSEPKERIEWINLRVKVIGRNPGLTLPREERPPIPPGEIMKEKRPVYFKGQGYIETPIYERDRFRCGTEISGPCLIEETISTTLLPTGWKGTIDGYRNILITPNTKF
jgi:N-methylhydantoinase A